MLSKYEWEVIERPILTWVKHIKGIQKTSPNAILYHESTVSLACLWQYIMVSHTSRFLNTISFPTSAAAVTLMIRLRQGQLRSRCTVNIFDSIQQYRNIFETEAKHIFVVDCLIMLNDLGIKVIVDEQMTVTFTIHGEGTPILDEWLCRFPN